MNELVHTIAQKLSHNPVFYITALATIVGSLMVAFTRNIVHSAFALLLTFMGVTGLYIFLSADFMAAVQVLIYVGAVLVLIIFGIMLTGREMVMRREHHPGVRMAVATLMALTVFFVIALGLKMADWSLVFDNGEMSMWEGAGSMGAQHGPTTGKVAHLLLGKYLLPFEIISVLLLAALVGGVVISRGHADE